MERIAVDSKVHFGKPCVAGTRITVQDVLDLVDEDLPFGQIIREYYPDLTVGDIHACIRCASSVRSRVRRTGVVGAPRRRGRG